MSSFTIEDMLAKRIEELEDAHAKLFRDFSLFKSALIDLSQDVGLSQGSYDNGMTDLAYARRKLRWVRIKAAEVLEEVDFLNE
ncbi:hypothetical protein UFOVP1292_35 [uncultured Caudovirales phage]|uniref:Uncharacterized protein n=1 Tax=uncultured Caudovirales phage TaxID=2100421 RepID=A0A6J5RSA0_9CAUD|nr:hypothetical protein UFOVP859_60 [uncultured Caudovirales phage]CAB4168532.1 hypothetical protein UFOVP882_58 [uncultured Caudovirales phage]CAB4196431.1 hypothetical protein UFOVP1292_35 [uncultured Caudovirales phage]CAB4205126.1 hypothetical protein UFOVP1411_26 [uncultured Caudovirales phage]